MFEGLFLLNTSTYYTFLESLDPGVQIEIIHRHDDHHYDDQEDQE